MSINLKLSSFFICRNLIPHLSLDEVLQYYKSAYLRIPELAAIERQIEERKLYYAQEDNQ